MSTVMELPIPPGMTDAEILSLRQEIAIHLFERAFLSRREAAEWLGVSYEEFRDLAARKQVGALRYDSQSARREMERLGIAPR